MTQIKLKHFTRNLMQCLDLFCQASVKQLTIKKSKYFFSKNVDNQPQEVVEHNGFSQVNSLGRYMGANIVS
ncbi:hypothetical protein MTR_2g028740 [Medicago truncatula]|uniref:Uncharacterized protein n=1 Tax=Medicago truncatula TaxID=3880 RepID=G7IFU5_MEDTR|nr:hypothetical protein MTR_2g028740 [Medicago truncatula]